MAVDALSRVEHEAIYSEITIIIPNWVTDVKSYEGDTEFQPIIQAKMVNNSAHPTFTLQGGVLRKNSKICVGKGTGLRQKLISTFHDTALGGHSGIMGTYQRLKGMFHWLKMKEDVFQWVQTCDVYQCSKADHAPYPGLLQPLPIPNQAWTSISMDFIEGLPKWDGKDCILVVVNRLTKYAHFISLTHPFSAESVAHLFLDQVHKLHGLPAQIISDRDRTERVNQCVENYLRCMCHLRPKQWNQWLSLAEYLYNTNFHTSLKLTPFQALYGYSPGSLTVDPYIPTIQLEVKEYLAERRRLVELHKQNLKEAQNRMKVYADKHRSERSFDVANYVFLKLQPYSQNSLQLRKNLKLAPKYYGPFQVEEKIGKVAYKLKLPPHTNIHHVFHVSLLKRKIGHRHTPSPSLPIFTNHGVCRAYPTKILARRLISRRNTVVPQILIQWENYSEEEATWEDYYDMASKFSDLDKDPQGRGSISPGGDVMIMKTQSQPSIYT
ncbi:UNVERIFIED_CONTAM: hypothetical protein Sradi_4010800 [Sesamum radiatum]|uniref:Uncharacterized protein n=1 Tax=Sesamum radiatum TaxID=300843 RepID=A0AAW2PHL1_SESRA